MTSNKRLLLFFLLAKFVFLAAIAVSGYLALAPDEAQYWVWSHNLDFGYYSKPPGIAWQIAATTALFGKTEFGVRFGALLIGFFLAWIIFFTALKIDLKERTAFWAALAFALSPLGFYLSFAATTDGGMILFLTLALAVTLKERNFILAGVFILLAALFKWTAFLFWPIALTIFWKNLDKKTFLFGLLISLLALLPSLYWNWNHDFATFRHVFTQVAGTSAKKGGNFFEFLVSQTALFSSFFFVIALLGIIYVFRKRSLVTLCAYFSCFSLIYLFLSLFKKMQPNWALYLYPPAFIVMAYYAIEVLRRGAVWLHLGAYKAALFILFALAIPYIQSSKLFPFKYAWSPFRQNMGWHKIENILEHVEYNPTTDFLFSDKYQVVSLLSFYAPERNRSYFFNLSGQRKNQFSYFPQMEREIGKSGYFMIAENKVREELPWYESHYLKLLAPYFQKVTYEGAYPLFESGGIPVKYAMVFKGEGYNGNLPEKINKY